MSGWNPGLLHTYKETGYNDPYSKEKKLMQTNIEMTQILKL